MKILLHVCCGPCSIYPVRVLRDAQHDVMGFFYGSNIHPYTECLRRRQTLSDYADKISLKLIISDAYDIEYFLRNVVYREKNRCLFCYQERLRTTAHIAKRGNFDAFSTTLLYSKYQNHETIQSIGSSVGQEIGIPFYYQDFRSGWQEGVDTSKRLGMYRQQYCGCIYSEKERYYRRR
ncbi:MAG: epoxyqueuosine reductase QueH [Desulfobacteraceae bacterium]|jgi:predicted adenine nucleotide alpha hydrolase (AANH) superfamily ATPase